MGLKMKIVIVGGVAGGASAAARARRLSETAEIVLFERGPYVSFANCGLPYYVGDEIKAREKLIVTTPERLRQRFKIDVQTSCNVVEVDRARKEVVVEKVGTKDLIRQPYDKLVLSPGASPVLPAIPGINSANVFTLRTLEDVDRIKARVDSGIKHVVVVGAGFIGLEMVENLVHRNVKVSLIQLSNQILPVVDREMTTPILAELKSKGVDVLLNTTVSEVSPKDDRLVAKLSNGIAIDSDMILFGIGVRPESKLAIDSGLATGPRGGIVTNAFMQTSDPDIYAVGDAIETEDFVLKIRTQVPLAGPANRQGRLAVDHMFGRKVMFRGTQATSIVKVFNMVVASTGASERILQRESKSYQKIYLHPANHAGYYPGAQGMSIKLLFEPGDGKILGAQITGGEGVDKRIDVLAMAIQAGMTVFDLEESELAYAPQFGSAKDPINMAGFIAAGVVRNDHPIIHVDQLSQLESSCLIDVRTDEEFRLGTIPGAKSIPVDQLRERLNEIPNKEQVVVFCQVGQRGYIATRILQQRGYNVRNLSGGYKAYRLFFPA
jgi:NADPH-dependent 2,4-dienoyl-CoA reductase/sulfur reductase-like enzyme/rhodanese-related sulfurtransferase